MARTKTASSLPPSWTIADALEAYGVEGWGEGFFTVGDEGNVKVTPKPGDAGAIDMKRLVDDLRRRGIELPILLRFSDIVHARIATLNNEFRRAMKEYEYKGDYCGVYPIKVNQSRRLVEEIIRFGEPYNYGLEAGSKPELLAVMAMHQDPKALIVCNGYKDAEYIETALLASKLGRTVVLVVEKPSEIDEIYKAARGMNIAPTIGIRARLAARGAGRWEQSGGDRSKFGLTAGEMLEAVEKLRGWNMLDRLQLVHFHLGSQISSIRSIKRGLLEAARIYAGLYKVGCTSMRYVDVGGGLGVDYDGSRSAYGSSINYTITEYANDVVYAIQEVCEDAGVPEPTIVTESGRAVAAHHAVLVVDVLGVNSLPTADIPDDLEIADEAPAELHNLLECYRNITQRNLREFYHDAIEYKDRAQQLFNLGHLDLAGRVLGEQLFWAICGKAQAIVDDLSHVPKELKRLEKMLSDTYFCNFSMFQSLPDLWAVDQQFPIMPIHRLNELPGRRGILADITCDSDGTIDSFIDPRASKSTLELHEHKPGEAYYLGIFLVGAYQEILGDMHNLFGDTNIVHVSLEPGGGYSIGEVIEGDTVAEVLRYVGYSVDALARKLHKNIESALRAGTISPEESRQLTQHFQRGMRSYTYLSPRD